MLAVLLMVRINYHHRVMMAKRRIPALDGYMDRINLLLWPRFKAWLCNSQILHPVSPDQLKQLRCDGARP